MLRPCQRGVWIEKTSDTVDTLRMLGREMSGAYTHAACICDLRYKMQRVVITVRMLMSETCPQVRDL
jgi:hypothetical protein